MLVRLLLFLALSASLFAEVWNERIWTGKNGKIFRGVYYRPVEDGKYLFYLMKGTPIKVDPANLIESDRKLIEDHERKVAEQKKSALARENAEPGTSPSDFKPEPIVDRSTIPIIDQGKYGNKASDCVPSSFCNFLLWWDQQEYIAIDKRGDFDRKAEWIHTRVGRYFKTRNNSGTSLEDAQKGFTKYFQRDLTETATFKYMVVRDCSPKNLARFTKGTLATMLRVTIFYGDKAEGGHWVALTKASENGEIQFNTWGKAMKGKLVEVPGKTEQPRPQGQPNEIALKRYKIEITDQASLTANMITYDIRFEIIPANYDFLNIVAPYRYKEGSPKPAPPADPRLQLE